MNACLGLLLFTLPGLRGTEPQDATDPGLVAAQRTLDEGIARLVKLDEEREELLLDSRAPAPDVPEPFQLDLQWGSGHGGTLTMVRITVEEGEAYVEELTYARGRWEEPRQWSARRSQRTAAQLRPLLDLFRALVRTEVSTRRKPDAPLGGRYSGSTRDFFLLARLLRPGAEKVEREFCGYAGSRTSLEYAGLQVVVDAARNLLQEDDGWTEVPAEALRRTHFTSAFQQNAELMLRDFHWWVMERSVEALGVFGNREALATLRMLDEQFPDPQPRQRNKIRNLLALPGHYLSGPPQEVPEEALGTPEDG